MLIVVCGSIAPDAQAAEQETRTQLHNHEAVNLLELTHNGASEKTDKKRQKEDTIGVQST
jgi:hypothetical protein